MPQELPRPEGLSQPSPDMLSVRLDDKSRGESLAAAEAATDQANARFRIAMDAAPNGIALLDRDGRILEANVALGRILGVHPSMLTDCLLWEFNRGARSPSVEASNREEPGLSQLEEITSVADPVTNSMLSYDLSTVRADGTPIWVKVEVTFVREAADPTLAFIVSVEDMTAAHLVQQQLEFQATHDLLTSTENRAGLIRAIGGYLNDPDVQVAVLFCDVDHFTMINDSLGQDAGDTVLLTLAERIVTLVGDAGHVGRVGGDSFAIVYPLTRPDANVDALIQKINAAVNKEILVDGHHVHATVSTGSAVSGPASTALGLLRDADVALSRVRHHGTSNWAAFTDGMRLEIQRRMSMQETMKRAIDQREFIPYFQPIVRLSTREIVGYETLARWNRDGGVTAPAEFLAVAEHTGLIVPIGEQLLKQAVEFLRRLPEPKFITFNMAAQQFYHLHTLLAPYRDVLNRLALEVTETSAFKLSDHARNDLLALTRTGVSLWVDDFGTGFSSIATLRDFPVNGLKLDRSFVDPLDKATDDPTHAYGIADSLSRLASNLGLVGIAEGIETPAQAKAVEKMGWQYGQGYLLGRPAPAAEWLKATKPRPF